MAASSRPRLCSVTVEEHRHDDDDNEQQYGAHDEGNRDAELRELIPLRVQSRGTLEIRVPEAASSTLGPWLVGLPSAALKWIQVRVALSLLGTLASSSLLVGHSKDLSHSQPGGNSPGPA